MAKSNSESTAPLIRQFSKQIAGHTVVKGSTKPGMMKHEDGSVLKPILPPPRGPRELNFYKQVFDESCQDEVMIQLRSLLPTFHGVFSVKNDANSTVDVEYMKLEDVTESFIRPCILDVKMGARTYDPEASEAKIKRERSKYKGTKSFGFCIPGMRAYDLKNHTYICKGKEYGKSLDQTNIKDAFRSYLNCDTAICLPVIESFLLRLREVSSWFSVQTKYHFFASSLLFVYGADTILSPSLSLQHHSHNCEDSTIAQSQDQLHDLKNLTQLKMIDFAHVFNASDHDANYTLGLDSLINIFTELLAECKLKTSKE